MFIGSSFNALPLRWRHVQATIRLLQVLHVLADVVIDPFRQPPRLT